MPPSIALTADWLPVYGGAEHVLAEFQRIYPDAPLFTTVARHGSLGPLDGTDIRTHPRLQRLYRIVRNHQLLLHLLPRAMEELDVSGYDIVLSSSHAVGKGILPGSSALHVCYCHTPARYAWEMEDDYLKDFPLPRPLERFVRTQLMRLRRWDLTTALRTDVFIANSTATQERIARIYGRESTVIPPPVEERFFAGELRDTSYETRAMRHELRDARNDRGTTFATERYFLAVGRLVPYKRFDLLITLANELQLPLKIAGSGQDGQRLKAMAGPTVEMLGFVPDDALPALYAGADALLFPQYEDAGIVPLEAQACGTPVIAYAKGGALDTVAPGTTGVLFPTQATAALHDALRSFWSHRWDPATIRSHARQYSQERFRERIAAFLAQEWDAHRKNPARERRYAF